MCCRLFIGLKCLWTQQPPDGVPGIPGHWGEEPMALTGGKGWHLSPSLPRSRLRLTNSEPAQHDKKETLTRQPGTKSRKCGFWFQTHPDSCSISMCIWPSSFSFLICKVKRMIEPSSRGCCEDLERSWEGREQASTVAPLTFPLAMPPGLCTRSSPCLALPPLILYPLPPSSLFVFPILLL